MPWTAQDRAGVLNSFKDLDEEQIAQFPIDLQRGDREFTDKEEELWCKLLHEWTPKKAQRLISTIRSLTPEHQAWFPKEVMEGKRPLTCEENQMLHHFGNVEIFDESGKMLV